MAKVISFSRLPIIVILGATGAGKSKLALEIAVKYNGEIISADSMQVYKKLDIVTNKVTQEEMKLCPHHMIDLISPLTTTYNVVDFRNTALPIIDGIISRNRIPIIVGGTNYYIESLLWKLLIEAESQCVGKGPEDSVLPSGECTERSEEFLQPPGECLETNVSTTLPPGVGVKGHVETSGESNRPQSPNKRLKVAENDRELLQVKSSEELYRRLQEIDPERAKQLHPHDKRKLLRSLEVFFTHGKKMSDYLKEQRQNKSVEGVSGPLRYPNPCVIWVKCQKQVLDARTDKRVDQMIDQGLLEELQSFHTEYNQARVCDGQPADYTHGIFQSIGFKEFHHYLILSEEEKDADSGKEALKKGIEDMKRATRQYARRQLKWMVNRFLKRRGGSVPSVYAVDSTDPALWSEKVNKPACEVVEAFLQNTDVPFDPLPLERSVSTPEYNKCDVCDLTFLTSEQWQFHLKGRRHKKNVERRNRMGREESEKRKVKSSEKVQEKT